jgi:ligand-binding SRPBCC domain-containing protein
VIRHVIRQSLWIPRPREDVFSFFARAENLSRITPPELGFRILSGTPVNMARGAMIDYTISLYGIPMKWRTEITHWNPPYSFEDTQRRGPYGEWVHTHRFIEALDGTTIEDRVVYSMRFGAVGRLVHPVVARQLRRIFDYRTRILAQLFGDEASVAGKPPLTVSSAAGTYAHAHRRR